MLSNSHTPPTFCSSIVYSDDSTYGSVASTKSTMQRHSTLAVSPSTLTSENSTEVKVGPHALTHELRILVEIFTYAVESVHRSP